MFLLKFSHETGKKTTRYITKKHRHTEIFDFATQEG
jgi:hypothetical protein